MKIAITTSSAKSLLNFRYHLIKELVQRNFIVYALAPDFDEGTKSNLVKMGVRPIDIYMNRTGINPFSDIVTLITLIYWFLKNKPDLCLFYFMKPVIYGAIAARLSGCNKAFVMIEGLGYAFTENRSGLQSSRKKVLKLLMIFMLKIALKKVNKAIFLNVDDFKVFEKLSLIDKDRSFILGGIGVDLDKWLLHPPVVSPVTFIMVARLLVEKGVEDYVKSAFIVKSIYPNVRFILLGGLDDNPSSINLNKLESWVERGAVEWKGHTEVQPWLAISSVFVLPSYREGVPASTQEAMAMGRPVITTDVPGCRETVINEDNGFLVPVQDPESLAKAMIKFVENPYLIKKMGLRSRQIAEDKFNVHKVNKILIQQMELQ